MANRELRRRAPQNEPQSAPVKFKRFEFVMDRDEFGKYGLDAELRYSFDLGDDAEFSWSLKLQTNHGENFTYNLYLTPEFELPSGVDIKFKLGVIMKDGTEGKVKRGQILSGTDVCVWGYPGYLRGYFYCDGEGDEYFIDDKLTIFCDIEVDRKIRLSEINLGHNMSRMFESGKFTDFTLVVGKEELKAHRAVLASRSPVFEAMFQEDKAKDRLEIKNLGVVGVKGLLEFIYSGKVSNLGKVATKVLPAAEKFGVDELKTLCEEAIYNKKNAANFLIMAELHSTNLSTEALEYINKSSAEVAEEERFCELAKTNPKVFKEIVKAFDVKRVNESDPIEPTQKRFKLH